MMLTRAIVVTAFALTLGACSLPPMTEADIGAAIAKCGAQGRPAYLRHQHADSGPVVGVRCGDMTKNFQ